MDKKHIGFLHPGAMGISLASTAQSTGHTAYWVPRDRSPDTHTRAAKYDLVEAQTIEELCDRCSVIISVCPPHAAAEVANQILACSFEGVYADVNAISPERAMRIGQSMTDAGATFVDGGIIGGPAWSSGETWLYLSGRGADQVAACFTGGPLETEIIGDEIGRASGLKMCFAAYFKGLTALMCATVAAAEGMGVRAELEMHWARDGSDFAQRTLERISQVTLKAWRFSGEMDEIASTFETAGIPGGFHLAAGEIYDRMARFKGADPIPPVKDVLDALLSPDQK
ncbi:MAG: phosphogluconate dehydrogenase [Verrucomicrobia bacterium]|nr:MAG: phosphogluconate dehydrogenase [Verrucomicrobiota bacterium]